MLSKISQIKFELHVRSGALDVFFFQCDSNTKNSRLNKMKIQKSLHGVCNINKTGHFVFYKYIIMPRAQMKISDRPTNPARIELFSFTCI